MFSEKYINMRLYESAICPKRIQHIPFRLAPSIITSITKLSNRSAKEGMVTSLSTNIRSLSIFWGL